MPVVRLGGEPSFIAVRFARTRQVRPRSVDASRRKRSARARLGRSTTTHHVVPLRARLRMRPVIFGRVQVRHPFDDSARRLARITPTRWLAVATTNAVPRGRPSRPQRLKVRALSVERERMFGSVDAT